MYVNIIYVCICLYCVICLILYYRSLLICTNKEFMNYYFFNNKWNSLKQNFSTTSELTKLHHLAFFYGRCPELSCQSRACSIIMSVKVVKKVFKDIGLQFQFFFIKSILYAKILLSQKF